MEEKHDREEKEEAEQSLEAVKRDKTSNGNKEEEGEEDIELQGISSALSDQKVIYKAGVRLAYLSMELFQWLGELAISILLDKENLLL